MTTKSKGCCSGGLSVIMIWIVIFAIFNPNITAQGSAPSVYLEGVVHHLDGTEANGTIYIWHDADEDGSVDFGEAELESATIYNGEWMSASQYGCGLPVIFQTHTDGDYVATEEYTVPTGRADLDFGDIFTVPVIYARDRDETPTVRVMDKSGWNMLTDNFTVADYLQIYTTFHISILKSLGQGAYYDLGAQEKFGGWALDFYVEDSNIHPTGNYDYSVSDPVGCHYYFLLDPIDGTDIGGASYTLQTEWQVLGDTEVSIQICDPFRVYEYSSPIAHKPSNSTFKVEDWECIPTGGEIEFYTEPAEVIYYPGGVVWFAPDDIVCGGGGTGNDDILAEYEWITDIVYENPAIFIIFGIVSWMSFTRSGKKFKRKLTRGSFLPKRTPKPKIEDVITDEELEQVREMAEDIRRDPYISGWETQTAASQVDVAPAVPEVHSVDHEEYEDAYDSYLQRYPYYKTIRDVAETLAVSPALVSQKFAEIRAIRSDVDPKDTSLTDVVHIPPPPEDRIWVLECRECGDPAEEEQLKDDPSLGKCWKCESCGRINVIEGTKR